jgi:NAD(P)-dependent dehydrogenase (short-subunit alcohol dehydrogenase family)
MRLAGKVGIVVGAGQTPGETVGTGRAAAIVFAREGAKVMLADRDLAAARETESMILDAGGVAASVRADWTDAADCQAMAAACLDAWGRIDFLQNNVGIGAGDRDPLRLTEEAFDRIMTVNLKGCLFSCQAVLPAMRDQRDGSIVNISSIAALAAATRLTAYKLSKAAINALGHSLAIDNAAHGIRVNTIMPGLLDTPMAVDARAAHTHVPREEIVARRAAAVPLRGQMGTAWDVAHASLFLHSDEAQFITGAVLPVDGGQLARVGG